MPVSLHHTGMMFLYMFDSTRIHIYISYRKFDSRKLFDSFNI